MASPPNIPSISMYLRQGAIIDSIVNNVYGYDKKYFRMVYNRQIRTNANVQRTIPLEVNYIAEIIASLTEGYIGTGFKESNTLVFNRKL